MLTCRLGEFEFIDYTELPEELVRRVWECRNLPEIRCQMVNTEPIPLSRHLDFIEKLKSDEKSIYFAVVSGGELIGSVNLHLGEDMEAERGIYILPEYQGQGFAKRICTELYKYARERLGVECITTTVLRGNDRSNGLERSLGARLSREDGRYCYYRYNFGN